MEGMQDVALTLDQLKQLLHQFDGLWQQGVDFVTTNIKPLTVAGLIILIGSLVDRVAHYRKLYWHTFGREQLLRGVLYQGKSIMKLTGKRREEVMRTAADKITDALEEAFNQGLLNGDEKLWFYIKLGNFFSLEDLLPKGTKLLKNHIKAERNGNPARNKPVKLPDAENVIPFKKEDNKLAILRKSKSAA